MDIDKTIHILIAEDDTPNRQLLLNILTTTGFSNVVEAENGKIAWDLLNSKKFDLLLTDWMMPEMDGLDLLKKIRKSSGELKHLPVMMITALGKSDDILKAAQWDINGYIVKPYSVNTILAKIANVLK